MVLPDSVLKRFIANLKASLPEDPYLKHHAGIVDYIIRQFETHDCSESALDFMAYTLSAWAEMIAQKVQLGTLLLHECPTFVCDHTPDSTAAKPRYQMSAQVEREGKVHVVLSGAVQGDQQAAISDWTQRLLKLAYEFAGNLEAHPVGENVDVYWMLWLDKLG